MMGRIKPGVSSETSQASLNVALSAAVRATMDVKKDNQLPAWSCATAAGSESIH